MKTKKEICAETRITPVTLLSWRREGIIPDPSGIRGREATWPDDILARVREIQRLKGLGLSLADIRARFIEEAEAKSLQAELVKAKRQLDHLARWDDSERIKLAMSLMLDIKCGAVAHTLGRIDGSHYCFATVSNGKTVFIVKVKIDNINASFVDSIQLTIDEYTEIVATLCRLHASKGDVFDIRDLAARAFLAPDQFNDIREIVKATLQLREAGQTMLDGVAKLKAKTDLSSLE